MSPALTHDTALQRWQEAAWRMDVLVAQLEQYVLPTTFNPLTIEDRQDSELVVLAELQGIYALLLGTFTMADLIQALRTTQLAVKTISQRVAAQRPEVTEAQLSEIAVHLGVILDGLVQVQARETTNPDAEEEK